MRFPKSAVLFSILAVGVVCGAGADARRVKPAPAPVEAVAPEEPLVVDRQAAPAEAVETLEATPGLPVEGAAATDSAVGSEESAPAAAQEPDAAANDAAVAPVAKEKPAAAPAPTAPRTPAYPPMFEVTDADSHIYIIGTFHALPANIDWRSDALGRAADEAEVVVFEAEVDSPPNRRRAQQVAANKGRNPPGVLLSQILGPEDSALLDAAAGDLGVDPALLQPMRPWMAFFQLSNSFLFKQGFDPRAGLEQQLLTEARTRGRQLRFFETIDAQLALFTDMKPDQEKHLLQVTLRDWKDQPADVQAMLEAWRHGDLDTIDRLMNGQMREEAPDVYDRLIVKRNEAWADKVQQMLDGTGTVLVAVGSAHLAGEQSLPALLAARGDAVKRIGLPPETAAN